MINMLLVFHQTTVGLLFSLSEKYHGNPAISRKKLAAAKIVVSPKSMHVI